MPGQPGGSRRESGVRIPYVIGSTPATERRNAAPTKWPCREVWPFPPPCHGGDSPVQIRSGSPCRRLTPTARRGITPLDTRTSPSGPGPLASTQMTRVRISPSAPLSTPDEPVGAKRAAARRVRTHLEGEAPAAVAPVSKTGRVGDGSGVRLLLLPRLMSLGRCRRRNERQLVARCSTPSPDELTRCARAKRRPPSSRHRSTPTARSPRSSCPSAGTGRQRGFRIRGPGRGVRVRPPGRAPRPPRRPHGRWRWGTRTDASG